jgi:hypothetical protein
MPVRTVYWDEVSASELYWRPETVGRHLAILPGPIEDDECFRKAGFTDFVDSDDAWHAHVRGILERLLSLTSRQGSPWLLVDHCHRALFKLVSGWWLSNRRPPEVALVDALEYTLDNDNIEPSVVAFGRPPVATLRGSAGHPIIWLWERAPVLTSEEVMSEVGEGFQVERIALKWSGLA